MFSMLWWLVRQIAVASLVRLIKNKCVILWKNAIVQFLLTFLKNWEVQWVHNENKKIKNKNNYPSKKVLMEVYKAALEQQHQLTQLMQKAADKSLVTRKWRQKQLDKFASTMSTDSTLNQELQLVHLCVRTASDPITQSSSDDDHKCSECLGTLNAL